MGTEAKQPPLTAIQIDKLDKSFGDHAVLKQVCLSIEKGRSMVLLGRSGSGKSVLLKCLLGLLPIDGGAFQMDGNPVDSNNLDARQERLRHIGMVFQGSALFDSLSVWENITFGLWQTKKISTKEAARNLAAEMLDAVGLESGVMDLSPAELSGGMQRRVALARAIAQKPSFLFCDEPTAGLDPVFSALISRLIRDRISSLKATALTITHDLNCAARVADDVAMLHQGTIVWTGDVKSLKTTDHPVVRQFVDANPDDERLVAM